MRKTILLLLILCTTALALWLRPLRTGTAQTDAEEPSILSVIPAVLGMNSIGTLDVRIDCQAASCSAFDVLLTFDPTQLNVSDIQAGPYLGDQVILVENSVDNEAGTAHLAVAVLGDVPITEDDVVARLTILTFTPGLSSLQFGPIQVGDEEGKAIPANGAGGMVAAIDQEAFQISLEAYQASDLFAYANFLPEVMSQSCRILPDETTQELGTIGSGAVVRVVGYTAVELPIGAEPPEMLWYMVEWPSDDTHDVRCWAPADSLLVQEGDGAPLSTAEEIEQVVPEVPGDTEGEIIEVSSAVCTVRTALSDVNVRLGPGTDEEAVNLLPPNQNIPVIGWAADSRGDLWWNVALVAPATNEIGEYWVSALAGLTTSGPCFRVIAGAVPQNLPPLTTLSNANGTPVVLPFRITQTRVPTSTNVPPAAQQQQVLPVFQTAQAISSPTVNSSAPEATNTPRATNVPADTAVPPSNTPLPAATNTLRPTDEPNPTRTPRPTDAPRPTRTPRPTDAPPPTNPPPATNPPATDPPPPTNPPPTDPPPPTNEPAPTDAPAPTDEPKPTKEPKETKEPRDTKEPKDNRLELQAIVATPVPLLQPTSTPIDGSASLDSDSTDAVCMPSSCLCQPAVVQCPPGRPDCWTYFCVDSCGMAWSTTSSTQPCTYGDPTGS